MQHSLVGRGWAFPPQIDEYGRVALVKDFEEISQAIRIILETSQGERVMRPEFGCRLYELLFAPVNLETMALARQYVEDALLMWEPRINLVEVNVFDPFAESANYQAREGTLEIEIKYEIKSSGDQRSLVYPFYLIPGE